jgi:hypothetical protein
MDTLDVTTANGVGVKINAEDIGIWEQHRWHASILDNRPDRVIKKPYVYTTVYLGMQDGKPKLQTVYLHRKLMDAGKGQTVDHINGDPLDNRRENLRLATRSEQNMNRGLSSNNTSGFKGICYLKRDRKWWAYIHVNRKRTSLGYFDTPEEAARAYDRAAVQMHGEFALLNYQTEQ